MGPKVFICYRRDDSSGHAGRVHDRLEREFGSDLLFMDVDSVPLGVNFSKALIEEVAKCDVLLAVIGRGCWNQSNSGNPGDARKTGNCGSRVVRGGSWVNSPQSLRSAHRGGNTPAYKNNSFGFRVARTLTP